MADIFAILEKEGYKTSDELKGYYEKINLWKLWWKGYVPSFHKYKITNLDHRLYEMKRRRLVMAKKVAEDWANFLLNDKTLINVTDKATQKYLSGDENEQNGGILGRSHFWKNGNRAIEKEFALGTAVFYLQLVNPKIDKKAKLYADSVRIKYIKDASKIIPLSWEDEEVTECAIYSNVYKKNEEYVYLQIFSVEDDSRYKITNLYYKVNSTNNYEKVNNLNGEAEAYYLPAKPFFILMPNVENNMLDNVPMGVSVYANAIDQLKGCDIAYDNLYNDIILGRKKVFMNEDIIATGPVEIKDSNGIKKTVERPLVGEAIEQSLYVSFGKRLPNENQLYEEYNPALRIEENEKAIQLNLNLLSSKVGFGQNKYTFNVRSMNTATEVKASNKDLTESVWKQRIMINEVLVDMTRSILIIAKEICSAEVDPETKITVKFDDTMFSDQEAERMQDLNEVNTGIMQKYEYRMKWYGEDEKTAKSMCSYSEATESIEFKEANIVGI